MSQQELYGITYNVHENKLTSPSAPMGLPIPGPEKGFEVTATGIDLDENLKKRVKEKVAEKVATQIVKQSEEWIQRQAELLLTDPHFMNGVRDTARRWISEKFTEFLRDRID